MSTCNDIGVRENSVVMAAGASMPMPAIINPQNTEEWRQQRERQNSKKPEFTDGRWEKGTVQEGEQVVLIAYVRDIADGNAVTFQIWKEGQSGNVEIGQNLYIEVVDEYEQYLGEAVEYELRHDSGETISGDCAEQIEHDSLIPGKWEIMLSYNEKKDTDNSNVNEAPAMEADAVRLELTPQEAFDNPVEVPTGKKLRIVVRNPQADISD